jgi:hypothetical protein
MHIEFIGRLMEVFGEFPNNPQIPFYSTLSIVPTLEFLQHHFSEMGHRDLLVTHTISPSSADLSPLSSTRSVRRVSGFVQTRLRPFIAANWKFKNTLLPIRHA